MAAASRADRARKVHDVLSEPDLFPDEFKSWLPRFLYGHPLLKISKAALETPLGENWHNVGATSEPAFQNSWVNNGGGFAAASFMKDYIGFVHLRGVVKSGTAGSVVFSLPAGYRPSSTELFIVDANDAVGRITVFASGDVQVTIGNNAFVQLSGIAFKAA